MDITYARVSRMAWLALCGLALAAGLSIGSGVSRADDSNYWEQQRQQALQNEQRQAEQHNQEVQRQWQEQSRQQNLEAERQMQQRQRDSQPYTYTSPQGGTQICQRGAGGLYCQ